MDEWMNDSLNLFIKGFPRSNCVTSSADSYIVALRDIYLSLGRAEIGYE